LIAGRIAWCDERIAAHVRSDKQYLRILLVQGARSAVMTAHKHACILWAL